LDSSGPCGTTTTTKVQDSKTVTKFVVTKLLLSPSRIGSNHHRLGSQLNLSCSVRVCFFFFFFLQRPTFTARKMLVLVSDPAPAPAAAARYVYIFPLGDSSSLSAAAGC
jgi:hypothetical protein